jgi:hypothetical protein
MTRIFEANLRKELARHDLIAPWLLVTSMAGLSSSPPVRQESSSLLGAIMRIDEAGLRLRLPTFTTPEDQDARNSAAWGCQ